MNQLALGLRLKAHGLDAAEHGSLTWVEEMRHHAQFVSLRSGEVTADDVRDHARAIGWKPEKPNAFGAVFRPVAKSGKPGFKPIGWTQSKWPSNHGRSIRIWKWIPNESPSTIPEAPPSTSGPNMGDPQPDSPSGGGGKGAMGEA